MLKTSHRISLALLSLCLLLVLPSVVHAQFDASTLLRAQQNGQNTGLYGNNPFDQSENEGENPEGEQQDSTRERKIRKPLESYFFGDSIRALNNFRWHVSRDYNRVNVDADRLQDRLPVLPRGCGRHRAGCAGTDLAAAELFPAATVL